MTVKDPSFMFVGYKDLNLQNVKINFRNSTVSKILFETFAYVKSSQIVFWTL